MKDLPTWSDLNKGVRKMTDKEFEYCEEMEKRKHDDKLKELREVQLLSQHILDLQKTNGALTDRVRELEQQIEKMKCCENCRYCNKWGEANSNSPNCKKCNWVSNWKVRR